MIQQIGQFQIVEEVGRGAMGTVYRGVDTVIGRPAAVKVLHLRGYLLREARAAGRLSHPGIVTIYQVGEHDNLAYIAMEFVDGPTLKKVLESDSPPDTAQLLQILSQAAEALDHAHQCGLVHRDVKPENIMVTAAGIAKLTDFGVAKNILGQTVTQTAEVSGTPCYMSPEQIAARPLDGRSDQFALAVIAYRMLTGRLPFEAPHASGVWYQILYQDPTFPPLNERVSGVLRRALAKAPRDRFPTCAAFARALIDATAATPTQPAKPLRRRFLPAAAAILAATLAFARFPAAPHSIPKQTVVVWKGDAQPGDLVHIQLPGKASRVKVYPAALTEDGIIVYTDEPTQTIPQYRSEYDPRHATDLAVYSLPSEINGNALVIRANTPLTAVAVELDN